MNSMGLLAGVKHMRAVERTQRAIVRRARRGERGAGKQSLGKQVGGWLLWMTAILALPTLVVVAAWNDAASTHSAFPAWWACIAAAAVLIGSGHMFQSNALSFSAREVLFLPDKPTVLTVRLWRMLPQLLLIGAAWATACWLHLHEVASEHTFLVVVGCVTAWLSPLAWTIGRLLRRLVAPGSEASLTLWLLVVFPVALALHRPTWAKSDVVYWIALVALSLLGGVSAFGLVRAWWRQPRVEWRALWPDVVSLPRLAVACVLLMPASALAECDNLLLLVGIASVSLLASLLVAWPQVLVRVRGAEAETAKSGPEHSPLAAVPERHRPRFAMASQRHRGRSQWRAAWRLGLAEGLWKRIQALFWPAFLLMRVLDPLPWSEGKDLGWMVILIALGMPVFLAERRHLRERLWLWGIDHGELARHNLMATLLCAALPVLAVLVLVSTWQGWTEGRAFLVSGVAATFLLRVGWRGFAPLGEFEPVGGRLLLIVLGALVVAFLVPVLQWWTVLPAAVLGVLGLVLRIVRWREPRLGAAQAAA